MLEVERDGAQLFTGAALRHIAELERAFADLPKDRAGARIPDLSFAPGLFASGGAIGSIAASRTGSAARPVRAIVFDKTAEANWTLDWHQDRTICVQARVEAPGFGPWTVKTGLLHVTPPYELLSRMVTIRVHLDDTNGDNAPLLIAPGSHRLGRIAEPDIEATVARCGTFACLASAGDVWLYSTPILHASKPAQRAIRRRVLQLDYAAFELPHGLRWRALI
jgi:hypothetical protein